MAFYPGTSNADTTIGGSEADTINGLQGADMLYGMGGNDTMSGGNDNDTMYGGDGADTMNGDSGNDVLYGEDGDDTMNGGTGADTLSGGSGNDSINGDGGEDALVGGSGNDTLTGGSGIDTFSYSFVVSSGSSFTFTDWVEDMGHTLAGATQSFFSTHYTAWLNWLVSEYDLGSDADLDGVVEVGLGQNAEIGTPWIEGLSAEQLDELFGDRTEIELITGATTQTRYFSDSFSLGSTGVTSTDGMDRIMDFRARSAGADMLVFNGIADAAEFALYFDVTDDTSVAGSTAFDTVITLKGDSSWSLILVDFTGFNPAEHITYLV